jgi:hypothetical protein
MLQFNPFLRPSAAECMQSDFFLQVKKGKQTVNVNVPTNSEELPRENVDIQEMKS